MPLDPAVKMEGRYGSSHFLTDPGHQGRMSNPFESGEIRSQASTLTAPRSRRFSSLKSNAPDRAYFSSASRPFFSVWLFRFPRRLLGASWH